MIWLLLSIVCSTAIFVTFKLFDKFNVDNLQAIVINYFIAYGFGTLFTGFTHSPLNIPSFAWFGSALILGVMFVTLFQIMALVSQKIGVSVVSVAVKMSLIVPVLFAVYYYNEKAGITKMAGVILALFAVFLATRKKEKIKLHPSYAWLPLILFAGCGFLDAFLKYNQQELIPPEEHSVFTSSTFLISGLAGIGFLLARAFKKRVKFQWKNLIGGIILGIPNYGSIYFLLKALEFEGLESSVIFPVNNVGIVLLSVLTGTFIFRERLSFQNRIGIVLAILSILLVAFENIS